jgi:hypothetical protein
VQASYGTYFGSGLNPWLICISYYGNAAGHTGTWCTYSLDGGATWSDEVLVSSFYDSGGASEPVALYMSPRTPGLAYTVAFSATANPATGSGYVTYDWGATWSAMVATVDPLEVPPGWGVFNTLGVFSYQGAGTSGNYHSEVVSTGPIQTVITYLILAPPPDTKRVRVHGSWQGIAHRSSPFTSASLAVNGQRPAGVTATTISNSVTGGGYDNTTYGDFVAEYTFSGAGDWPEVDSDTIVSTPPSSPSGLRWKLTTVATGNGSTAEVQLVVTVLEIELDGGHIYTPVESGIIVPLHGQGGEIYLPYDDNVDESIFYYGSLDRATNRLYDLKRYSGSLASISPNDGSKDYGINHGQFAVRSFDGDRQKMVVAGTGNDATGSTSGDKQGVWVSANAGTTMTQIVAPTTGTEPYSAAFSGDNGDILFIWGPALYMGYTTNFGSSIDSRAGNLSALSATKICGIAGGPTG